MVKRERYLGESQNRALEQRAKELGISETELMQRALHTALGTAGGASSGPFQRAALTQLVKSARALSEGHFFPESYRLDRSALYDEGREKLLKRR